MPKPNPDAEFALHNLGQRIRKGFAHKHPVEQKTLDTVKDTIREQYEQEQEAEREKTPDPQAEKAKEPQPPEPEQDR
jgi:hypothetical protein